MTGMVTPFTSSNENGNLFCICESDLVMICNIIVDKGSLIEAAVGMRLNRNNPVELHPFFLLDIDSSQPSNSDMTDIDLPLGFEAVGDYDPPVQARIFVYHSNIIPLKSKRYSKLQRSISVPDMREIPSLRRVHSSPSKLNYPENRIPLCLCRGVCPITQNPFKPNDMVYVLKTDSHNIAQTKSVSCISALGLKRLAQRSSEGTFGDPLRRVEQTDLTLKHSYDAYVIYDDPSACDGPSDSPKMADRVEADSPDQEDHVQAFKTTSQMSQNIVMILKLTLFFTLFSFFIYIYFVFFHIENSFNMYTVIV